MIAHQVPSDLRAQDFDHPEWAKAAAIQLHRYWSGEKAPDSRQAEARIVWSRESLCVRFLCRQNEPLVITPNPQTRIKTIGLWDRDVCEIFIAPNPDKIERYYEYEAAPTGEWLDLAIQAKPEGRETDQAFHSGMSVAAQIAKNQIIIAMRIPLDGELPKPYPGVRWRVNLFRCMGSGNGRGYLAWQPTRTRKPDFHVPDAFGWLVFGD